MLVKVQPFWGEVTLNLSTLSRLGILQGEAGVRTQSDRPVILTLALMRSPDGETEPEKASQYNAGLQEKHPDIA